jgi:hypothetical protein
MTLPRLLPVAAARLCSCARSIAGIMCKGRCCFHCHIAFRAPTHYAADEAPWTVDGVFTQPDSVGRQWPCAQCAQQPATRPSCLYGPNASAKTLDESRVV